MEKTLESIFIKQYEDMEKRLEKANSKIYELEGKKEAKKEEILVKPVVFKTFSKECCYLEVSDDYNIIKTSHFKDLSSDKVKEIIDNNDMLKEYANKKDDHWEYSGGTTIVNIKTRTFPYSTLIQGHVILLDCHKYTSFNVDCFVLENKDNLQKNKFFDIKEKDRLYKYGLELFKKELQEVYEKKLKEEQENAQ